MAARAGAGKLGHVAASKACMLMPWCGAALQPLQTHPWHHAADNWCWHNRKIDQLLTRALFKASHSQLTAADCSTLNW
jgi:hypothetical protein